MEFIARQAKSAWKPETEISGSTQYLGVLSYGMSRFDEIFTSRQLLALTTFSDLVREARAKVIEEAKNTGMADDGLGLDQGGTGATAYRDAVAVYLALAVDKSVDYWSTVCSWHSSKELIRNTFGRHAIPMTWDYAETNPFSSSAGKVRSGFEWAYKALVRFPADILCHAQQADASNQNISLAHICHFTPLFCRFWPEIGGFQKVN